MATIAITFCQSNGSSSKESFQMKVKKLGKKKIISSMCPISMISSGIVKWKSGQKTESETSNKP